jgi:glycine cleavage system transcriptional repressor
MANYALLTAIGRNRPGIVAAITGVLLENDCNIEDSQMGQLGPEFACMLLVRMPEGLVARQMTERFEMDAVVKELGMKVRLSSLLPEEAHDTRSDYPKYLIRVHGADHKGIVHQLTKHLGAQSVNITNLHTEVHHQEPPLYVMTIEVEVPPFVDADQLAKDLKAIGESIAVKVSMSFCDPDKLEA